jgi:putative heme-binding domain-containing protein
MRWCYLATLLALGLTLSAEAPRPSANQAAPPKSNANDTFDASTVRRLLAEARAQGDRLRGAHVFAAPQFACLSCHKVGSQGGTVGPDLTLLGRCLPPEEIVESVLWPRRKVKEGYVAWMVQTADGRSYTGYKEREDKKELVLRDPTKGTSLRLAKANIEEQREIGTLMPDGLTAAMSDSQQRDLIRFLLDLGVAGNVSADKLLAQTSLAVSFPYQRDPLVAAD